MMQVEDNEAMMLKRIECEFLREMMEIQKFERVKSECVEGSEMMSDGI